MSPAPPQRPDIVVVCNHRDEHGPYEFVQRFHWRDGAWIPMDTSGENWVNVGGVTDLSSPEAIAAAPAGRWHLRAECKTCRSKVPMVDGLVAQAVLTWIADRIAAAGLPVVPPIPIAELRREYERVSAQWRP